MKNVLRMLFVVTAMIGLVGCGGMADHRSPGHNAQSNKARVTSPDVSPADVAELVEGNSAFAWELYQFLKEKKGGNLCYSPHSISLALAMTFPGARGETERQMADTLHFGLSQERLHPAFNSLDLELARRGETDDQGFRLDVANAIWGQEGHTFLPQFLDTLAENYGAGLWLLDFAGAPGESRVAINDWVSDQTEDRIRDLIRPGVISPETVLVLTNAVYFDAAWAEPFEQDATKDGTFHLLDGGQVTVPMMQQTAYLGYAEGHGYRAVELPYAGGQVAMVILLPETDRLEMFENTLTVQDVNAVLGNLAYTEMTLTLPKFEIESDLGLVEMLAAMGMPDAFDDTADFSGMDGTRGLFIQGVVHQAFVSVDEAGTEAAAATAVVMDLKGMPQPSVEVVVDHPFAFLIRDVETGAILFVGRVVDPTA